jgi:hypothetical protein
MYILTYNQFFKKVVAKVDFSLFLAECNFSTSINYSANMCWTSYEPTVFGHSRFTSIYFNEQRGPNPRYTWNVWVLENNQVKIKALGEILIWRNL